MKYGKYKLRKYAMIKVILILVLILIILGIVVGATYIIKNIRTDNKTKDININMYKEDKDYIKSEEYTRDEISSMKKDIQNKEKIAKENEVLDKNKRVALEMVGPEKEGNVNRKVAYIEEIKGTKYYVVQVYEVITDNKEMPNLTTTLAWIYVDIDNKKMYMKDIKTNELVKI